jgi:pimeloyl-ACP methyl ester carboxylesterase
MDAPESDRRRLLRAVAAGAAVALAGCAGDGDDAATTTTDTTTAAPTTTRTATTEETTTETTTAGLSEAEQRERAIELTQLLADGDFETAHTMLAEQVQGQISVDGLQSAWNQAAGENGRFTGVSGVERTTAEGYDVLVVRAQFEAGAVNVQVSFREGRIEGLRFVPPQGEYSPPDYADQSAFEEQTLALSSPACDLGATLSVPTGGANTGVVLVHGSGPHDRDETIGPNKPFKDLAWGLASRGVAVLRYDKRTYACDVATDELGFGPLVVDDALTGLDRLRSETAVSDTAVLGHSLGGYAAPRIASRDGDASAFLLAAPSRPLYELIPEQVRYLASLDGDVSAAERERIDAVDATSDRLAAGDFEGGGFSWGADFWRDTADYDPVSAATSLDASVYALQGGRDYQVTPDGDFPAWRDALGDANTRLYDSLNHLFVPGEGDPNPSEYSQPGNVAEPVVSDLAGWLTG